MARCLVKHRDFTFKEDPVEKKLAQYKHEWLNHVNRREDIRY